MSYSSCEPLRVGRRGTRLRQGPPSRQRQTAVENTHSRPAPSTADLARVLPLGDLLALGMQLRADITPEVLLQEVAEAIYSVLGYPQVYIRLRNADTDELEAVAFAGVPEELAAQLRANPTAPAFYQALFQPQYRLSESYLIPAGKSVERERQGGNGAARRRRLPDRGVLLVPLRSRGDRLAGAIYVEPPDTADVLDLPNLQILEAIARQAALALENARLAARSARLLAKEQLLAELGRDVSNTLDLDTILTRTVERLGVAFQGCSIALLSQQDELEIVAAVGQIDDAARGVRLRAGEGISGWVVERGIPYLCNDVQSEQRVPPAAIGVGTNQLIRSYIAVPLRTGGRVLGSLNVESDQVNAFTYEDVDLLEAVAAQIGGPIASTRLYQEAQRLAEQVERRNEHLTVLNAIARMAVSTLDVERMLAAVTEQIRQGFGYEYVEVYLVDEENRTLELAAQAGAHMPHELGYQAPLEQGLLGRAHRAGRTVRVDDLPDPAIGDPERVTRSQLCVPIVASGRVLAVLNLESPLPGAFSDEGVGVLETAADVLASAIENARLYQRAQEAAVLEERGRLARDLHDSISQQLFSMTLTAQAARVQLEKNPLRTASQLERLQETAGAALAEMRALIYQLRPPGLSEQGLVAALQQHVAAVGRREGLTVTLEVAGEERHARSAEQQIYRIVQEALNNVVKHAGACRVTITLDLQPEQITLQVVDDGAGFDINVLDPLSGRHLGLTSMRERAAELGGRMALRSEPGKGTKVVVVVPRDRAGLTR
ncbi:MAG: GAF domain-containing sensor histidine kinase [Kouleothrix sp.]|nr:GAF domain-containing sensor histidine kinase [Kouleothrix sp.]